MSARENIERIVSTSEEYITPALSKCARVELGITTDSRAHRSNTWSWTIPPRTPFRANLAARAEGIADPADATTRCEESAAKWLRYALVMFVTCTRVVVAFALPWLREVATCQSASPPESDDGRQWLNSRIPAPSPIAVASRANALNQDEAAEKLLHRIIRRAPRSPEAGEAHKLLSRIYVRTGRYKRAADNLSEWLRDFPNSADAQAEQRDLGPFRGLPDQINGRRRTSVLKHEGDLWAPLSVNGKECTFLMDTGAWVSVISQNAAERLDWSFAVTVA